MTDMLEKVGRAIHRTLFPHLPSGMFDTDPKHRQHLYDTAKAIIKTTGKSLLVAVRGACQICDNRRPVDDDTCPYCGSIVEAIKKEMDAALEGRE